jgi:hypothetical protein
MNGTGRSGAPSVGGLAVTRRFSKHAALVRDQQPAVVGEGDLAAGVVVPGAVSDFGVFAVGGAVGGTPRRVGASGTCAPSGSR